MLGKQICCILLLAATCSSAPHFDDEVLRTNKFGTDIGLYIFEDDILARLEELRHILKYGIPEYNIPPMEPLHIKDLNFDFILNDTTLTGFFRDTFVANVSDFNVTQLAFKILPSVKLTLGLYFEALELDGLYQLVGILFQDIPLDGRGNFRSTVSGLQLNILLDMVGRNGGVFIKKMDLSFTQQKIEFEYSNEITGENSIHVPPKVSSELANEIQARYFPLLLNTLTLVANDLLYGVSIEDIIGIITGNFL